MQWNSCAVPTSCVPLSKVALKASLRGSSTVMPVPSLLHPSRSPIHSSRNPLLRSTVSELRRSMPRSDMAMRGCASALLAKQSAKENDASTGPTRLSSGEKEVQSCTTAPRAGPCGVMRHAWVGQ